MFDRFQPMISNVPIATISTDDFDAMVFDLDGVVTQTAQVHAATWKRLFDDVLKKHAAKSGKAFKPFDADRDYVKYVDGKPRYDGVRDFLASRNISLPYGDPADPPERETICGLGNRKNVLFLEHLENEGVEVFLSSVALIVDAREKGLKTAVVSSSRNCEAVVRAAGIDELFDVQVSGADLEARKLEGKPRPDMFIAAANDLDVDPARTVVVEDAISGVQAAKAGQFGMVIGVAREPQAARIRASLLKHGADVVVEDLEEVMIVGPVISDDLPSALEAFDEIGDRIGDDNGEGRRTALLLDYDGTLTPIVQKPEDAVLSNEMRDLLEDLSRKCTIAIVSGRDRPDVQQLVGLDDLYYIGCHGFDIGGPRGFGPTDGIGDAFLPEIDEAEQALKDASRDISGAQVERKKYSVAVHYRRVASEQVDDFKKRIEELAAAHPSLRKGAGKMVYEFTPDVQWHKGSAVLWLLDELFGDEEVTAIYIGDDATDENAFTSLTAQGITILVADEPKPTAAHYILRDHDEVLTFLRRISGVLAGAAR